MTSEQPIKEQKAWAILTPKGRIIIESVNKARYVSWKLALKKIGGTFYGITERGYRLVRVSIHFEKYD